jgi:uncharacterized membrane protein YgcG
MKLVAVLVGIFGFMVILPASTVLADCDNPATTKEAIQCGTNNASGATDSADAGATLDHTIENVINLISLVVGIIAVIFIVLGGLKYITSGGNSDKTKSAKDTILYALIGLVIVALAQVIVQFVLDKTTDQVSGSGSSSSSSGGTSSTSSTSTTSSGGSSTTSSSGGRPD